MDAELVANASNITIGVSALVVALIASFGINRWRKELKGKTKYEVARNVMKLAYKVEADLRILRSPFTWSGEFSERQKREDETANVIPVMDEWYAREKRLEILIEDLPKLEEAGWEAKIVLNETTGRQVTEAIAKLKRTYALTRAAISSYFDLMYEAAKGADISKHQNLITKLRDDIYSTEGDNTSMDIEGAISELSSALQTYIK